MKWEEEEVPVMFCWFDYLQVSPHCYPDSPPVIVLPHQIQIAFHSVFGKDRYAP